ncbi:MAG: ThuA domain-containing protein [Planctomycetota bacterium]
MHTLAVALVLATLVVTSGCVSPADTGQIPHRLPGSGKHIVFVTGDEEYRSEEGMPQLAQILTKHHGFTCTVLYALDSNGHIDPDRQDNIPGLEALTTADLLVLFTRFRDLPDDQMRHIVDYVESGRPIVGLRTATHAFDCRSSTTYERYSWRSKTWSGGFGRQVLGETWINHHGGHKTQSARGIIAPAAAEHPIVTGIADGDIWDPADVYGVRLPLLPGCTPLVLGQVLDGMTPDSPAARPRTDEKTGQTVDQNEPMMPIAWTREYTTPTQHRARVFTTTIGSAQAFEHAGSRRLIVNACYWALRLEHAIRANSSVAIVGEYSPSPFGFGGYRPNQLPVVVHLRADVE